MGAGSVLLLAFAIGAITGLRSMTGPAAVSWAARLKWLNLGQTSLAFLGYAATPYIFSVLALGELVADKLPKTPSRKKPGPFAGRIILGGLSGAALCAGAGLPLFWGVLSGTAGGVAGTLGGYELRTGLVKALRVPDFVIALLEDAVAVGGAWFVVSRF
jgi:uncharacterized membrane protein